jgi:3-oxoacyl-[acyl-carrier-protein] synthase-3
MTLESLSRKLELNPSKVHTNIENIGNTVSASIPLCLRDAINEGSKLKLGDRILLSGFGVGLSYGTTSYKYEKKCYVY